MTNRQTDDRTPRVRSVFRPIVGAVILTLTAAACGGQPAQETSPTIHVDVSPSEGSTGAPLAIAVNSPGTLVPGEVRLLLALIDQDGSQIAGPDVPAQVQLLSPDTGQIVSTVAAGFVWTVPDARGLYVAQLDIPRPGVWGVVVVADGYEPSDPSGVQIFDDPVIPVPGVAAPRSVTPTGAEFDLAEISSDPTPNPRFYESSLDAVLGGGTPVVVVFATPALCTSAACGPMLDVVDEVAADFKDVAFVHVEVYTNLDAQTADLELAPAILEWGLPSEPWVFVMDGEGVVSSAFEGAINADELVTAIERAG